MPDKDLYSNAKVLSALDPVDWATDVEGNLIDIRPYTGRAQGVLMIKEDASIVDSKKLTVTVHNVASDAEAMDEDNQIAAFDVVEGGNYGSPTARIAYVDIPLDGLDDRYIQFNFEETSTYEAIVAAAVVLGGAREYPLNS